MPIEIYSQYQEGDLRKNLFFDTRDINRISFKGSYNGSIYNIFNGIATDEMYLILAESQIHMGKLVEALEVLNTLKIHRWDKEKIEPFSTVDKEECLDIIKAERFKQLFFRGQRISDCRRWSRIDQGIVLHRVIGDMRIPFDFSKTEMVWNIPDQVLNQVDLPQN